MNDFFTQLYDSLITNPDFADDLYNTNTYVTVGIVMVLVSLIGMALYYYGLSNYKDFSKLSGWLTCLVVLAIINFGLAWFFAHEEIANVYKNSEQGDPFIMTNYLWFSLINMMYSAIFSFVFSLGLKIKSVCASKTPF